MLNERSQRVTREQNARRRSSILTSLPRVASHNVVRTVSTPRRLLRRTRFVRRRPLRDDTGGV